jgi:hypothetical protein
MPKKIFIGCYISPELSKKIQLYYQKNGYFTQSEFLRTAIRQLLKWGTLF